jgi:hypothetical protein
VQVGELALRERLDVVDRSRQRADASRCEALMDLARFGELTELVERHREVDERLGVEGILCDGGLEVPARFGELASAVLDHPEHVVHVSEGDALIDQRAERRRGLVELTLRVLLPGDE